LDAGSDTLARNAESFTPLHFAARSGPEKLVELLLERGAAPNAQSTDGTTPLALARSDDIALLLLNAGGATDLMETWWLAVRNGWPWVLRECFSRIRIPKRDLNNALALAGSDAVTEILRKRGARRPVSLRGRVKSLLAYVVPNPHKHCPRCNKTGFVFLVKEFRCPNCRIHWTITRQDQSYRFEGKYDDGNPISYWLRRCEHCKRYTAGSETHYYEDGAHHEFDCELCHPA
jgi:hypothetical protein